MRNVERRCCVTSRQIPRGSHHAGEPTCKPRRGALRAALHLSAIDAHPCVGVEEVKLVLGGDVADDEGALADAPEAFALL